MPPRTGFLVVLLKITAKPDRADTKLPSYVLEKVEKKKISRRVPRMMTW